MPFQSFRIAFPRLRALVVGATTMTALVLLFAARTSKADQKGDTTHTAEVLDQCLADHLTSQKMQQLGRLLESQEHSYQCAAQHCPGQLRIDCLQWVNQLSERIPSLSFRVKVEGHREANVQVYVDGHLTLKRLSGQALNIDPGSHEIRIEAEGYSPYTEQITINEGERFRDIVADFERPSPPASLQPLADSKPAEGNSHVAEYVLAGIGLAATAHAIGWGVYASSGKSQLESECSPFCKQSSVDSIRRRGLIADISLGLGLSSIAGAAIVYFSRTKTVAPLEVAIVRGGLLGTVHLTF